jgi:L-asparaginase
MKTILLVFTGGTIGSTANDGTINTSEEAPFTLLQLFQHYYKNHQQVQFTTIQPLQLLSENSAPAAWTTLIEAIEAANYERYDGIIITHGTDTLAFTAAALSFYFHAANLPILLVSSNYPLNDPKANGLNNFICAVEFILQINRPGVFVPYRNLQQPIRIHKGTRLASSPQLSGDFFSVQGKNYMQFENGRFTVNYENPPPAKRFPLKADFYKRVLLIKPYPGLDYSHFDLNNVNVVLHDLYHSGTACSSRQWGNNRSLTEFIRNCRGRGIKIYLAPAVKSDNAYESTRALLDEGAEMIWNMSLESAYVKLLLAYGNFNDEKQIMDFINDDIAGEHLNHSNPPD